MGEGLVGLRLTQSKTDRKNTYLKRLDLDVFSRFLNVISEADKIRITNLSMKTGTNHSVCTKYVRFLETFGLANLVAIGKNKFVCITESGREAVKVMSSRFPLV